MQALLQMRNFYLPTLKITFRRCWENLQTRRKAYYLYDMSIHASNCSTLAELVSRNLMLGIRKVNVESF
jgi:hypothetical protein